MRNSRPNPPATGRAVAPETWFNALDQRRVGTAARHWDILVTGVHASGADCWIQLASAEDETRQLVLHVSRQTTVDAAVAALTVASQGELPSVLSL
jgi:hypothetical protein